MSRNRIAAILILVIAINAIVFVSRQWRESTTSLQQGARAHKLKQQQDLIATWENAESVAIDSPDLRNALEQVLTQEPRSDVPGGTVVEYQSLSQSDKDDLVRLLEQLLKAYEQRSGEQIYEMFTTRGMVPDAARFKLLKQVLKSDYGYDDAALEGSADKDIYLEYWKATNPQTEMTRIVPSESRATFWKPEISAEVQVEDPKHATRSVSAVWNGQAIYVCNFKNAEDASRSGEQILVADIELVVEHSNKSFNVKSPYIMRFVFNQSREQWQPVILAQPRTDKSLPLDLPF